MLTSNTPRQTHHRYTIFGTHNYNKLFIIYNSINLKLRFFLSINFSNKVISNQLNKGGAVYGAMGNKRKRATARPLNKVV